MADPSNEPLVLCAPVDGPLMLPDNLVTNCSECGRQVQYRPHSPPGRKMCAICALPGIMDGADVMVPMRMIEDAIAYVKKKKLLH